MWGKFSFVALLAASALALSACAAPQTSELTLSPGALPMEAEVRNVPFFPQEDNFCGPAALATVVAWTGISVNPEQIAERVYTPGRQGTLQSDILAAARREGRLAVPVVSLRDVMTEIAAGHPVLVLQNLSLGWYPQWHYAVAFAYNLEKNEITLRSGREPERIMPMDTFERTWQRGDHWALVVLNPDDLPASADVSHVEHAAAALERVDRTKEAAVAYSTILKRWPKSYPALMGLGNLRYADGDLATAEIAFRLAILEHPGRAEAWNNLAYVLAAKGRKREAVVAAQRAIKLSPDNEQPYLETLQDLSET
jgi:tetratricopeptide (TPR) repeat protein